MAVAGVTSRGRGTPDMVQDDPKFTIKNTRLSAEDVLSVARGLAPILKRRCAGAYARELRAVRAHWRTPISRDCPHADIPFSYGLVFV